MGAGDIALAARLERQQRPLARRRKDHVAVHDRRRDHPVAAIVARVESVGAPDFPASRRIMSGDDIAASDHDLCRAAVTQQRRGRYASGDSNRAFVSRLTRHMVLPVALSIRRRYDGSSVCIPWSTCT